jgi:hypothetical protein
VGFASSDYALVGLHPVQLPEHSQVLEILFQFIEPSSASRSYRQPSVIDLKLDIFFALAEAAEKYIVPSAMNICLTRMPYALLYLYPLIFLNSANPKAINTAPSS